MAVRKTIVSMSKWERATEERRRPNYIFGDMI